MDFIFEILLDLIIEGCFEASTSKKVPKIIRYPLISLIVLFFISWGNPIYVSSFPEIMEENKAKLELTKYRGPLGAYFTEYEMNYKNDEWQLKIITEAIS